MILEGICSEPRCFPSGRHAVPNWAGGLLSAALSSSRDATSTLKCFSTHSDKKSELSFADLIALINA